MGSNTSQTGDDASYLYSADYLGTYKGGMHGYPDPPQMNVEFNASFVLITVRGPGTLTSKSSGKQLVGSVLAIFGGQLDAARSDEMLMGQGTPKWNATVGFTGDSAATGGGERAYPGMFCGYWLGVLLFAACIL